MLAVSFVDGVADLGELDDPVPGHRQLLVDVASAGLNGADLLQAASIHPDREPLSRPDLSIASVNWTRMAPSTISAPFEHSHHPLRPGDLDRSLWQEIGTCNWDVE